MFETDYIFFSVLTSSWGNNMTARENDLCSFFSYFTCGICESPQNAARYQRRWRLLTHPDTSAVPCGTVTAGSRGWSWPGSRADQPRCWCWWLFHSLSLFADNSRQGNRVPVFIRLLDVNDNAPTLATVYETFVCEKTKAGQVPVCLSVCH